MKPFLILIALTLITFNSMAQNINMESINATLKPQQSESESDELMLPDIRWGLQLQGFAPEMSDEGNITFGTYLKYKPFYRFDIDGGFKAYIASDDTYSFSKDAIQYNYSSFSGMQFFLALNASLALDKLNSNQAVYTSFETGYATNSSSLQQYNNNNDPIASQTLRDGNMYVEWKLGLNMYGNFLGENTGAKAYVGFNTVPFFLSAHNDREEKMDSKRKYQPVMLLVGVAFEFGVKKSTQQKNNKKYKKDNQSIIEKHQGKSDNLF